MFSLTNWDRTKSETSQTISQNELSKKELSNVTPASLAYYVGYSPLHLLSYLISDCKNDASIPGRANQERDAAHQR
jgi:hypothetical protein